MPRPDIDDELLDTVTQILQEDGVRGLSVSAIAQRSSVSRVTLHRRGWTLDDFIVAVLGRASDDLRASLWPALTGTGDAAERLAVALGTLCEVAERHSVVLMAFYGVPARALPGLPGRTTSFEFIEPFERLLLDGNIDGSLCSDDPSADATFIANGVCWTYLHMRQAHGWTAERAAARAIDMAVGFLRKAPTVGR